METNTTSSQIKGVIHDAQPVAGASAGCAVGRPVLRGFAFAVDSFGGAAQLLSLGVITFMIVFYLIHAIAILLLCGLPWLLVRRRVKNIDFRRALSSLIFALAFTPSIFGGDLGIVGFAPAFELLVRRLFGYFGPPFLFSIGSIAFVWGLIFIVRSVFSMYQNRSKHHDT
jgi:hypothetical protein